jgi:hypothetical protein
MSVPAKNILFPTLSLTVINFRGYRMDYFLTEDQKSIQDLARRIAEERVVPVRAELDMKGELKNGPAFLLHISISYRYLSDLTQSKH